MHQDRPHIHASGCFPFPRPPIKTPQKNPKCFLCSFPEGSITKKKKDTSESGDGNLSPELAADEETPLAPRDGADIVVILGRHGPEVVVPVVVGVVLFFVVCCLAFFCLLVLGFVVR